MRRRDWLKGAVGVGSAAIGLGLAGEARARDFAKPVPQAAGLTTYHNGANLLFRWNNEVIVAYRSHASLKYPYFSPLLGPKSGLSVVAESALPYPHHRGVWLACDPLAGGNYWSDGPLSQGHILSRQVEVLAASESKTPSATFRQRCDWVREGAESPLEDRRQFTLSVPNDRLYTIDCDMELTPKIDIEIRSAKHSLFAMRAAPDISPIYGGVLMNSEGGVGAEGTYAQPARWCGYHGKRRARPDVVEGIAIFDHPENFGEESPWFTREYGHLSPSPFNFLKMPWKRAEGETLRLRYRVVVHAGDPKEAQLDRLWKEWVG